MTTFISRISLLLLLLAPSLLSAQQQQQQSGAPERNSQFVVFIHAGGGDIPDRDLREIGAMLVRKGYVVRAPDRERDIGGPGVDYFSSLAQDAAQDVAETVNARLQALKLLPDENKKLKPRLQRVNNPPGYLGVWLF
jgi:hypothetical protein